MALNDGEINVKYQLQADQAAEELNRLKRNLDGLTANLVSTQRTIEHRVKLMMADLNKSLGAVSQGILNYGPTVRGQERAFANAMGAASRGGIKTQITEASVRSLIADMNASAEAVHTRLVNEVVNAYSKKLRTVDEAVASRLRLSRFSNDQLIGNNSEEQIRARTILAERRRQDILYEATHGRAAAASQRRVEVLNHNGGADLMGIQSRVMMNYAALAGVFNGIKGMGSFVVDLDKELHQFQAIAEATNSEMETFKVRLLDISATVPFTTLEMSQAATMLAQAGLSTKDVTDSLAAVTQFAVASGSDLASSVDVITSAMTAYNLQTSQTEQVANTFTAALNLSKLTVDKLITSLNYIGPTASALGISLQETTAVLGALSQSGVRASTMGTGFRTLLTNLQEPSKKLVAVLNAAGLSVEDINIKTQGALPVLERLKTAGFGAAQAYEALDLRAAASYVALSNNLGLAYDLEKAFMLSTAASKANDTQMKSLSNTFKNFYSVIAGAAYTAFEPLINALQVSAAAATNLVASLVQYPILLQAIGWAVGGVGFVAMAGMIISIGRGFKMLTPLLTTTTRLFQSQAAAVVAYSTGATSATAATVTLSRAMFVLRGAIAATGIGLGLLAASFVIERIANYVSGIESAADSVDRLKGAVNNLAGSRDQTDKKIEALSTAMADLLMKKEALDENPLMRSLKVDELVFQFGELGGSISASTHNTLELVSALNKLREEQYLIQAIEGRKLVTAQEDLLEGQKDILNTVGSDDVFNRNLMLRNRYKTHVFQAHSTGNVARWMQQLETQFGPDVAAAMQIAGGDRSLINASENPAHLVAKLNNALDQALRTANTEGSREDIKLLRELIETVRPIFNMVREVASTEAQTNVSRRQVRDAEIRSDPAYTEYNNRLAALQTEFSARVTELNKQGLGSAEKLTALQDIMGEFQTQLTADAEEFSNQIKASLKASESGATDAEIDDLLNAANSTVMAEVLLSQKQVMGKLTEEMKKHLKKVMPQVTRQFNTQFKASQDELGSSVTESMIETQAAAGRALLESFDNQITRYYEALIENSEGDEKEQFEVQLQTHKDQMDDRLRDYTNRTIDQHIKRLEKELDDTREAIKRAPTLNIQERLVAKSEGIVSALEDQLILRDVNKFNNLAPVSTGEAIPKAAAEKVVDAFTYYLSQGLSRGGAAGIVGNLMVESNLNPRAQGDRNKHGNPTAFGAAQWRFDRWDDMRSHAQAQGRSPFDLSAQLSFVLAEMKSKFPKLYAELQDPDITAAQAAQRFMEVYERPNKDPKINHIGRRVSYAEDINLRGGGSAVREVERQTEATSQAAHTNTVKLVKAVEDAHIKASQAAISRIKTQIKINKDSTSITELQDAIQTAHKRIFDAEMHKFDTVNVDLKTADPADFKRQREELQERLREAMNKDTLAAQQEYYKALEEQLKIPLTEAQNQLSIMTQPDMSSKYTLLDIQSAQILVREHERELVVSRIAMLEEQIAVARQRAADAEKAGRTSEADMWRLEENELIRRNNELKSENQILTDSLARSQYGLGEALKASTAGFLQQNGVLNSNGDLRSAAEQFGDAWSQVLGGLQSGLTSFFGSIFSGTTSAKDAVKQLGLSILQMFSDIIAKALANQIIMGLFHGGGLLSGMGGGFMSSLGTGLFTVPGMQNGGAIPMANGGPSPFRDNVLINADPREFLLRSSAVDAIGRDKLNELNNLGNRRLSPEGTPMLQQQSEASQGQGVVNVWVVSPDQQTQMGPNDVVATISDNISRRGSIRELIRSVQMGVI